MRIWNHLEKTNPYIWITKQTFSRVSLRFKPQKNRFKMRVRFFKKRKSFQISEISFQISEISFSIYEIAFFFCFWRFNTGNKPLHSEWVGFIPSVVPSFYNMHFAPYGVICKKNVGSNLVGLRWFL